MNHFGRSTSLTPELQAEADRLWEVARDAGLDPFTTIFELIDYKQLNEVAAYGGFPTRFPHWKWGMEYERLSKSYEYGLSIIYELVINNNPSYAYLLRANSMVYQKTVIAHVYGHVDFFKHNYWFSKTNRKMLDKMANHGAMVRELINKVGHDEVEAFIDTCLSIDNLIDIHSVFQAKPKKLSEEEKEELASRKAPKLGAKKYLDSYINPPEEIAARNRQLEEEAQKLATAFPEHPQKDILAFLLEFAPLKSWEKKILKMIRDEAYYFAPQGQTKILNEGWATYWHSKMMTQLAPLDAGDIIDYCDHYAGVVASHPGQLNPYKLGVELLRYVERRWNRGQFGLEYTNIEDPKVRAAWNTEAGLGRDKIFEIRSHHNDITFIDEYMDEDFCHETKMFLYERDRRTGRLVIASRDFKQIKSQLLDQLTNFGQPIIRVVDGNYKNRGELLLRHDHHKVDLKQDYTTETLRNLHRIWNRPVHIETIVEDVKRRISFDGSTHSSEKV